MALPKVLTAIGASLFGGGLLLSQERTTRYFSNKHINHVIEDDFVRHSYEVSQNASPYEGLNRIRNYILDPAQFHSVKRLYIQAKDYGKLVTDNIFPIGLVTTGLVYGTGHSMSGFLTGAGRAVSPFWRGAKYMGQMFTKAGWHSITKGTTFLVTQLPKILDPTKMTVKGSMFGASMIGLGLLGAARLKGEFDESNREDTFGHFLGGGGH